MFWAPIECTSSIWQMINLLIPLVQKKKKYILKKYYEGKLYISPFFFNPDVPLPGTVKPGSHIAAIAWDTCLWHSCGKKNDMGMLDWDVKKIVVNFPGKSAT